MDGAFNSGADNGGRGGPGAGRGGFRGNAENAKTRMCNRQVLAAFGATVIPQMSHLRRTCHLLRRAIWTSLAACRWMQGECRFGDRCNFAHGEHELRQLPPRSGDSFGRGGGRGPSMGYGGRGNGGRYGQGRVRDSAWVTQHLGPLDRKEGHFERAVLAINTVAMPHSRLSTYSACSSDTAISF